jgi:hypothetical protein
MTILHGNQLTAAEVHFTRESADAWLARLTTRRFQPNDRRLAPIQALASQFINASGDPL